MFKPKFTITPKIVKNLTEIAQIKGIVDRSPILPVREAFLRRWATARIAHTSTSIEGNTLGIKQVEKLMENKPVKAEEKQIREVKNYILALKLVDQISATKHILNKTDILSLHKKAISGLIDPEKIGVFRSGPVYIVNVLPGGEEQLAYTPPSSDQVPTLIDELLNWLPNDNHPIINAGLLHYQFETIHPFPDGNGRVGRLLTLLYLYQSGWNFRKVLVLEDYYNNNRKSYYNALQTGEDYLQRQEVDLTSWLEYFTDGFLAETKKVKDQISSLQTFGKNPKPIDTLSTDELKIVDFLLTVGKITSSDVVDILKVPQRTAQSKLGRLEKAKFLRKVGAGPSTYYALSKK